MKLGESQDIRVLQIPVRIMMKIRTSRSKQSLL